jgi:peptidoglycan DL-endopeptidase LytF
MRNPSQAILLAVLMASLILPPGLPVAGAAKVAPAAHGGVKSVLLVGDSLSIGLGQQMEKALANQPGITFAHLGKVSSGLANPAFFNWDVQLAAQLAAHHPDIVLIMVGANDNKPLPSGDGRSLPYGTKDWDQAYGVRLARLHAEVKADNPAAKVYFISVPVMADAAFDAQMVHMNTVLAAKAKALPDCAYIETRDVLADAAGGFASQAKAPDGELVRLRAADGVHVSSAGSRLLAVRCLASVSEAAGLAGTTVVAALENGEVRPVSARTGQTAANPTTPAQPALVAEAETKSAPDRAVSLAAMPANTAAKSASGAYTVADGDTLWSVAKRLGVSPDRLAEANPGVDPRHMSIGRALAVPADRTPVVTAARDEAATPVQAQVQSGRTQAVADGDNFWSVARRHGVTVAALTQANPGVEPTKLRIGQTLVIPDAGQPAVAAAPAPAPAANPAVAAAPAQPGPGYTVADGDNFWSIARRLGLDVAELKRVNAAVDPQKLQPGQVLALPAGVSVSEADRQAQTRPDSQTAQAAGETGLYPVAKGDTLWALSRRFGVSLDTMLSVNGDLDPSHLQVGQLVTIPGGNQPVAATDFMLFPVSAGDTLWDIARRFDVSVADIVAANPGVDPMRLHEGQTLRVPSSLAAVASPNRQAEQAPAAVPVVSDDGRQQLHSVEPGDTLWELSKRFGVSVGRILKDNAGIDPVRLRVGQTLRLSGTVVSMAAR